ncbi:UNVERIFIED_CONTAM: hypothetical protein Sradi_7064900 [Sesamum radiatum]|uniref:CCHC-type domain-containing protein n=1 Tax=Sesamum radiatum TaxID=300843 RepID=A0AAW2J5H7_SESRA
MEYWTEDGLSAVASGVGIPLYADKITKACSRLDYARVCVLIDYKSVLPKHVVIISPILQDGKETPTRVDIVYEWFPQKCINCCSLGHSGTNCPEGRKKSAPVPVTVYVRKEKPISADVSRDGAEVAGQTGERASDVAADVVSKVDVVNCPNKGHVRLGSTSHLRHVDSAQIFQREGGDGLGK